ncbi:unnamed protein product [Chrysodeixis includens]|uniref:Sulfotransferase domain-containing protein n=1 Tax=Chrysodeixis includens TaxID=689277 RepID=A0A9P0FPT2_CHRIL|nr:unnamed protein product [Chrysodeixis includens]
MAEFEFPHDINKVTEEEDKIIKKYYTGYARRFVRMGPQKYILSAGYGDHVPEIYNLDVRPDDIWVTTFPRSGTTWLQEIVWLIANNLDFETAKNVSITKRYAYIDYRAQRFEIRPESKDPSLKALTWTHDDFRTLPNMTSPRYVKSHLPLSFLPPKLLDTAKVFYIARDPRDVVVSYYFGHKLFRYFDADAAVEMKDFWDLFKNDLVMHTPILPHVKEAWLQRDHPNMMFLFYEELQNDVSSVIDKICSFLGKEYTAAQKQQLTEHVNFNNMKKKPIAGLPKKEEETEITFFRKGKSGNWRQYFDEEMTKEAEEYMERNLKDTDMRFPSVIH